MKKVKFIFIMLFFINAFAQNDKNSFTPTNYVTDLGNLYSNEEEAKLNSYLSEYEKKTSIEIAVVTIDSLGDESISEYANTQFNRLGLGKKGADNGMLIVFSVSDRKSRIEVGNGLEPFFTDVDASSALQVIKPYFRSSEYFDGTMEISKFVVSRLGNDPYDNMVTWLKEREKAKEVERQKSREELKTFFYNFFIALLVASFIGFIVYKSVKRHKLLKNISQNESKFDDLNKLFVKSKYKIDLLDNIYTETSEKLNALSPANEKLKSKTLEYYNAELNSMIEYKRTILSEYINRKSQIEKQYDDIADISKYIKSAENLNKSGLSDNSTIASYGYNGKYKDMTSSINDIKSIVTKVESLRQSSFSESLREYNRLLSIHNTITSVYDGNKIYLNSIIKSKDNVSKSDDLLKLESNNVMYYKSYFKNKEKEEMEDKIKEFNDLKSKENDILVLGGALMTLIAFMSSLKYKLKRRKDDEEEEEAAARRRRNSYTSSSSYGGYSSGSSYGGSSYDGSDSSGGFGGFGGGSSSGGGASDGW